MAQKKYGKKNAFDFSENRKEVRKLQKKRIIKEFKFFSQKYSVNLFICCCE